jgi:hypothetical protein
MDWEFRYALILQRMTLLREIQAAALDSNVDLADLLRKCKVLAARLKNKQFAHWVTQELNGYQPDDTVPAYRKIKVQSIGHFSGPFGSGIQNAPIPQALLPEEFRHFANQQIFVEPVGTLAAHVSKDTSSSVLQGKWPADLIAYLQRLRPIYEDMVLADAWRMIPAAAVKGILDTIRTRILDFALALEEREPTAGDTQPGEGPRLKNDLVTNIYNTVIHSGLANIGTAGDAHIKSGSISFGTSIPKARHDELTKMLGELHDQVASVPQQEDRSEATQALAKVESQLASPTPNVERVAKYLEIYATIVTVAAPTVDALKSVLHALFGG